MNLFIDIETIPSQDPNVHAEIAATITHPGNMSKPETIAAWEREKRPEAVAESIHRTALDGALGEIVVIGWAIDDEPVESRQRKPGESRGDMLKRTYSEIVSGVKFGTEVTFIGHNVRDFDLRFLYQQSVILGIRPPFALPHNTRPGDPRVFDTMTEWAGWGNRISLDRLCKALGLPGKPPGFDGSKVWGAVQEGRIDEVASYCRGDVEMTREVWRRMTFARF